MGNLIGHVIPGLGFFLIGLWHLFNHFYLHSTYPGSFESLPWFPSPKVKHLELILIMLGSAISVIMELFISHARHHPLDPDFTIPSSHLRNFEHALISMSFFTYAAFAMVLDCCASVTDPTRRSLTTLLGSVALGQELLLFRLHSTDHMGIEGEYHLLLQVLILTSLSAALLGIHRPRSLVIGLMRSASIMFQGMWLMVIGVMLWTPGLIPKGCYMNLEDGTYVVRCHTDTAQNRAKSLVNILFAWLLILVTAFSMSLYFAVRNIHDKKVDYQSLIKEDQLEDDNEDLDVESQRITTNRKAIS